MKNLKIIIKKNKGFLLLTCFFIFLIFILLFITPSHWTKKTDYRNIAHIFTSITFEQWDNEGAKNYYFAPVISYDNPGDKFVDIIHEYLIVEGIIIIYLTLLVVFYYLILY
ncbi:MAG TPA: hypothetical protein PKI46_08860 [Bacteroidales bacterium]|nr:hypothetical protein [Bacteroidales bacterium]